MFSMVDYHFILTVWFFLFIPHTLVLCDGMRIQICLLYLLYSWLKKEYSKTLMISIARLCGMCLWSQRGRGRRIKSSKSLLLDSSVWVQPRLYETLSYKTKTNKLWNEIKNAFCLGFCFSFHCQVFALKSGFWSLLWWLLFIMDCDWDMYVKQILSLQ